MNREAPDKHEALSSATEEIEAITKAEVAMIA